MTRDELVEFLIGRLIESGVDSARTKSVIADGELYGNMGPLDSLQLVTFLSHVEAGLQHKCNALDLFDDIEQLFYGGCLRWQALLDHLASRVSE